MAQLDKTYDPKNYEAKWYKFWTDKGYFHADSSSKKPPYTIIIPPPNVTDRLHMGHGLNNTIQDILIRWKRMSGFEACWLPGTDHAGIATQMMVEKSLAKEGLTKEQLGREKFTQRLHDWKERNGNIIIDQLKRLGSSADWEREAYTMDPKLSLAVRKIFVMLYEEGSIYRGERLVNWDPTLLTAISDDEIENEEKSGSLWVFKYPVVGTTEFISIATTRPETMLGDTGVAVHPEDERYKKFIGKKVKLPLVGREIPIIADEYVKSEFGTGAVKMTPAHDFNDFEVGKRHNLAMINIFHPNATLNENVPEKYRGLDRFVARKQILKDLKELDLFESEKGHKLSVPISDRSKDVIEPRLSKQWYVRMKGLAAPAVEAAKTNELSFYPDSWKKTYLYWLENVQDWCISRQLWWGHRIPIWYCNDCSGVTTGMTDPTECKECKSKNIHQDEDVLDTWFSSWLWPVSPFGWPEETADLKKFYPSNVLVTGADIIYLWVARMVMAGFKTMGTLPFQDVYFNSIICDKQGRKFSKTLGNGIDPLEMIDLYGADAVRFTCISLAPLGGRVRMSTEDFASGSRFINKIWNASRFMLSHANPDQPIASIQVDKLALPEQWLLSELDETIKKVGKHLENYRINDAVDALYHFLWGSFCDWGLECAKLSFSNPQTKDQTISVLVYVLETSLRLASPFIPFISEEIWHNLPKHPDIKKSESLCISEYPTGLNLNVPAGARDWTLVQECISAVRALRAQAEIEPSKMLSIHIKSTQNHEVLASAAPWFVALAKAKVGALNAKNKYLVQVGKGYEVFMAVDAIDNEKQLKRLNSEHQRVSKIILGLEKKLGDANFVDRAPEDVILSTKAQLENMNYQRKSLEVSLENFKA